MYLSKKQSAGRNGIFISLLVTIFAATILLMTPLPLQAAGSQWTPLGPYGGTVTSLAANKLSTMLYAGTSSSGIFKSSDAGLTWSPSNSGLTNPSIQVISVDRTNPSIVYAGASDGLYKSLDGGTTWSFTVFPIKITNMNILSLAVDPVTPSIIYAGTNGGGVLKSTNSGAGWSQYLAVGNAYVTALAMDPLTTTTIYAGTNGGIFKSLDAGVTWKAASTGLSNLLVKALAVDPVAATTVYAATGGGIFKSIDGGVTWIAANSGLSSTTVQAVALDPVTTATIYAATTGGIFKSSDAGATWSAVSSGLSSLSVKALLVDPVTSATLYAGSSDGGVFKSSTAGGAWSAINAGLNGISVQSLIMDATATANLFAGNSTYGVFKSANKGGLWSNSSAGLTSIAVTALAVDPLVSTTIYVGTSGGVFKSNDSGGTWGIINSGLTTTSVKSVAVDPVTPINIYAGTMGGGLFKSSNGGTSWAAANTGLPTLYVNAVAIDPVTPTIVYAGTMGGGIYKSSNGGTTWSTATIGLLPATTATINVLAINPVTTATIYAGTNDGLFKSSDAGATWSVASSGLYHIAPAIRSNPIQALAIDPVTTSTLYLFVNAAGLYKSLDGGLTWGIMTPSLSSASVYSLTFDRVTPTLLYAGANDGVYTLDTSLAGYVVTFNSNGGSPVPSQTISLNGTASTPTPPTWTGYIFAGWFSDAALTTPFSFTTAITVNTTLYAKWTVSGTPVPLAITWAKPTAITYGTPLSATQLNAISSVPGTFVYTPSAGTVLGTGTQTLSATFTPTNTLTYAITTVPVSLVINRATPILSWPGIASVPAGTLLSASQLNATASVPGTFVYLPAAGGVLSTAGTQILSLTFTPTDTINYANAAASNALTVTAAGATASRINVALAANGGVATVSSTISATNYPPASLNNGDRVGATWGTGGGWNDATINSYPDWAQITFNGVKSIDEIDVFTLQDALTASVAPTATMTFAKNGITAFDIQYCPSGATCTITGTTGWVTVPGGSITGNNLVWRKVTLTSPVTTDRIRVQVNAALGGYSRIIEIEAYGATTVVTPTPQTITWANPAAITYGTPLSATQLNALSSVPGSFVYTPAAGLLLPTGSQSLKTTFTPTDLITYTVVTASATITVNRATPIISWTVPSAVPAGTPLTVTQLNATTTVPGTFVYTPAAGATLAAGSQTLSVTFTPTDSVNYNTATTSVIMTATGTGIRSNVALSANGGVATVSSTNNATNYPPASLNNGDRIGATWGAGGGWNDATINSYPDWAQITFNSVKSIDEIDVITLQDALAASVAPTATMTFTKYGITAFDVQYCPSGSTCTISGTTGWVTVPGGSFTGNKLVWKSILLTTPVTTDRIRIQVNASLGGYSRIIEIEAYGK